MALSDAIHGHREAVKVQLSRSAPSGWEPGVKYDPSSGAPSEVTTDQVTQNVQDAPEEWAKLIEHLLPVVPEGHEVRLVEARYDPVAWTREREFVETPEGYDGEGQQTKAPAVTRPAWRYRFRIVPIEGARVPARLDELLATIKANRRTRLPAKVRAAERARVVGYGDTQIGKVASEGGTEELLERVDRIVSQVEEIAREEPCRELVLADPGDLVENIWNVRSQRGTNDAPLTAQLRIARAVITHIITRLSPLFETTRVLTVPSNHGQVRVAYGQDGAAGPPHDDFGLDCYHAVAEAFELANRKDVAFVMPKRWEESLAIQVRGAVLGLVHGHQARSGKVDEWWKGQTHGDGPTAAATILVNGHWHNARIYQSGYLRNQPRWIFQLDALDGGSDWWRNLTGERSEPSMTTFVVGDDGRWGGYRRVTLPLPPEVDLSPDQG